jgi:glycosyltransferase involved in cell wall biosynthesis
MEKLVRITTVPLSMRLLLEGQPAFMRTMGFDVILVSSEGPDWEKIPDIGSYPVYKIAMARRVDLVRDVLALWALYRLFRKIRPDIVHSHTPKAGLLGMLAAKFAGVRVRMHTVAGMPLMESRGLKRRILVLAERLTYRSASRVYPNSFQLKGIIERERLTSASKLTVIASGSSNGIDAGYFQRTEAVQEEAESLRQALSVPAGALVFVFVGRMVKDKGINELVCAFDGIARRHAAVRLLLVGPYEEELDPLEERTKRCIDVNDRIIHVGFRDDVRPYLALSDVLVFPSYREGFPNVPMQAGCLDLPCIVTDINGCNEIVEDGGNGVIVPVKDEKALSQAMERMIIDDALRTHCAAGARTRILEKYQQSVIWEALYEEYQRLLAVEPL